jgi:hypothetical protein
LQTKTTIEKKLTLKLPAQNLEIIPTEPNIEESHRSSEIIDNKESIFKERGGNEIKRSEKKSNKIFF